MGRLQGWRGEKGQGFKKFLGNIQCEQGKNQGCGEAGEGALGSLWPWRRHCCCPQVCIWPSGSHKSLFYHNVPSPRDGTMTQPCPSAERSPCLTQPPLNISSDQSPVRTDPFNSHTTKGWLLAPLHCPQSQKLEEQVMDLHPNSL